MHHASDPIRMILPNKNDGSFEPVALVEQQYAPPRGCSAHVDDLDNGLGERLKS